MDTNKISLLVFDFDGVFTDGKIYFDDNNHATKHYNAKDGMGIFNLHKQEIQVGVISGWRENNSQRAILEHLRISRVSLGSDGKLDILKKWCYELNIDLCEVAYMGDDLNDLEVMSKVGFVGCPADAVNEVKNIAQFISTKKGGSGCVREFCDHFIKIHHRKKAKISCVVPCANVDNTGGNINTRKFETTTLLQYKLDTIQHIGFHEIVLSTNDTNVIDTYKDFDHIQPVVRSDSLCSKSVSYRDLYDDHVNNITGDVLFHTTPISPFLSVESINNMISIWINNPNYDMVIFGENVSNIVTTSVEYRSLQQLGFICHKDVLTRYKNLKDIPCVKYIQPTDIEKVVINNETSFVIAECLLYRQITSKDLIYNYMHNKSFSRTAIFDCTIRDSGYMNNWNWSYDIVKEFVYYMGEIGVEYCEIGFILDNKYREEGSGIWRSINNDFDIVNKLKKDTNTKVKIAVMFDIGDYDNYNYDYTTIPPQSETNIDLIRVCCFNEVIERTTDVIYDLHKKGYTLTLNVMYASHLSKTDICSIKEFVKGKPIEYLYFADSIGGLIGNEIQQFFTDLKDIYPIKNGFHNHDNNGTVLTNVNMLIDTNIDIIDTTISGIGKNGGNCSFELTLLYLYFKRNYTDINIMKFFEFIEKIKEYEFTKFQKIDVIQIKDMVQQFMNIHPSYVKKYIHLPLPEYYSRLSEITTKSKW